MENLEKIRNKIKSLNEAEAKSLLMLIASHVNMVSTGNGSFTPEQCIDEIKKIYRSIPTPE